MVLLIRTEQQAVLSSAAVQQFKQRAIQHVASCWPREYHDRGPQEIARAVDKAVEHGPRMGLSTERDIIRYLDVFLLLKTDNQQAASQTWIQEIWEEPGLTPSEKVGLMWRKAKRVCSPKDHSLHRGQAEPVSGKTQL